MDYSLLIHSKHLVVKSFPIFAKLFWHAYKPSDFEPEDKLFHAFNHSDLDAENKINANAIRFPDFSCNWSRFSKPHSVRHRKNGNITDGCYSITTKISRYNGMATPCHDPSKKENNYSHIEVRQLSKGEGVFFEPSKNRKLDKEYQGWSKSQRLEYRTYLVLNLVIEIDPI